MSIFLKSPCELLAVELTVVAVVHAAEDAAQPSDTVGASLLEDY